MADRGLNDLQIEVLRLFFALPASEGFVLAGGAGLVAVGLSTRPTDDLDLFSATASVEAAGDALEAAVLDRNWTSERVQDSQTFRRIMVSTDDGDRVLVDLAQDAPPLGPATITAIGPAYPPAELAARKVLALFDRAALRDFVDVAIVSNRYDQDALLRLAAEIDEGFDISVFAQMLTTLDRFTDDQVRPLAEPSTIRSFFAAWAATLRSDAPPDSD